ncbi:MAG: septum formation initiator family protein [bacterium]|nr:septum formation initiator family protein [bacterium]
MSLNRARQPARYILLILAFGLLVWSSFWGRYSLVRIYQFRQQRERIRRDIVHIMEENQLLRKEIERLRSDPEYIARIAREDLGLAKPGEIIYRYHHLSKGKPIPKARR